MNWICICVKHKYGIPIKLPKPKEFEFVNIIQRLRIKPKDFKKDCVSLIVFFPMHLQIILVLARYKLVNEKPIVEEEWKDSPGFYQIQSKNLNNIEKVTHDFLTS
ncbi:hypothetical protein GCM10027566_08870 [Arachidicoccus ginsenosidivorans]